MQMNRTRTLVPVMIGHPLDTKNRRWARVDPRTVRDTHRPWYTTDAAS
jgi:hypothetical protein